MKRVSDRLRAMAPVQRRRFLSLLSAVVGAPAVPPAVRYACRDMAMGEAYAQQGATSEGILFLEFDYRDQVDLMHVMVPPGIARYANRKPGVDKRQLSMFESQNMIEEQPNNVFLTQDSMVLQPHIADIAMIDTGERAIGKIHGHEAGNGMRSPGRTIDDPSGGAPMFRPDEASEGGSEKLYSKVPTPASFHNYYTKLVDKQLHGTQTIKNGFAFKGISRYKHSVYHHHAGLEGGDLDRIGSKDLLFQAFPNVTQDINVLQSGEQAELLLSILRNVDQRFLGKRGYAQDVGLRHVTELNSAKLGFFDPNPTAIQLDLNQEEIDYWSPGVPGQKCTLGDAEVVDCVASEEMVGKAETNFVGGFIKAEIWEQFAYAHKLLTSGLVKSIALEFDFMDLHGDGVRTESVLRDQAQQVCLPLARIISKLKQANLWQRTLIAVYTLDGSRTPAANSYGDQGKGTMLLAGGMVKGGYYGDIVITEDTEEGHNYGFAAPDPVTGIPSPNPAMSHVDEARTSSAAAWRTVMKAAGVPDALIEEKNFSQEVTDARPLGFMLK